MVFFRNRSEKKELLDLQRYTPKEYVDCLKMLGRIGKHFGCWKIMEEACHSTLPNQTILDVGCGGGDFTANLAKAFPLANVVGTDIDEQAINYAQKQWAKQPNLTFHHRNLSDEDDKSYDIVTATLVCHHLTANELSSFLSQAQRVAKKSLIFNDLNRNLLAYLLFAITSPILFPNRLIFFDGLLSIKRSFVYRDWEKALKCFDHWHAELHWPFRWIVRVDL